MAERNLRCRPSPRRKHRPKPTTRRRGRRQRPQTSPRTSQIILYDQDSLAGRRSQCGSWGRRGCCQSGGDHEFRFLWLIETSSQNSDSSKIYSSSRTFRVGNGASSWPGRKVILTAPSEVLRISLTLCSFRPCETATSQKPCARAA